MNDRIPSKIIKKYFWDIDLKEADLPKYRQFIIERILEGGDQEAIQWLNKSFSKEAIKKALFSSRRLSGRSRAYWQLILGIWKKYPPKKSWAKRPVGIWKF